MQEFKNPYSLLNYDMENMKSTPEFERATEFIDDTIEEMVKEIKSEESSVDLEEIVGCFYINLHWSSIQEAQSCGNARVDAAIACAVEKLREFAKDHPDNGGIGDTATDECIAFRVDELLSTDGDATELREKLGTKAFELANELAKAGFGDEAVAMHRIANSLF